MYVFKISICDAEPQFNDDTNKRYHFRIPYKELEQLKNMLA